MKLAEDIEETWWWLWASVVNPPVEFTSDYGTENGVEQWTRRQCWSVFKPMWVYFIFAKQLECGCVRRWWGTKSIFCMKHGWEEATKPWITKSP